MSLDVKGGFIGLFVGAMTLIPTALAFIAGKLPRLAPTRWDHLHPITLGMSNLSKAILYWFRLGSLDIGRRMRRVEFLTETINSESTLAQLIKISVGVLTVLTLATTAISAIASWWYFRKPLPNEKVIEGDWHWIRFYALSFLVAVVIVSLIACVPVQGWHLVIALHAACLPMAFWLKETLLGRKKWFHAVAVIYIILQVTITLLMAHGNRRYIQPKDPKKMEEIVPSDLMDLFHSRLPVSPGSLCNPMPE